MENDPVLVIMAAGMGSRYGGLKQIDPLGPNGEIILDYSVGDAIYAGFKKVVFIIKKEIENDFKKLVESRFNGKIEIKYAYQELNSHLNDFKIPPNRVKPWGTGHAVLCAENEIGNAPFVVINSDDYYGPLSYRLIHFHLLNQKTDDFSMVGYYLKNTLSESGGVTRGVCYLDDNENLSKVVETSGLIRKNDSIIDENNNEYDENTICSMNFWGLNNNFIKYVKKEFKVFLTEHGKSQKSEFLLPSLVNALLKNTDVNVLSTNDKWFGVTYKEDRPFVMEALKQITCKI